jgi:hypothetical protein
LTVREIHARLRAMYALDVSPGLLTRCPGAIADGIAVRIGERNI